jgi:nucleoside phosphorylase
MKVDVAIVTALQKELDAVLKQYSGWKKVRGRPRSIRRYHVIQIASGLRVAAVKAHQMGQVNASIIASDILADCSPQIILLVGIAAGIGENINLGDVVVSNQLIDYEVAKLTYEGQSTRFNSLRSSPFLLAQLNDFNDSEWTHKIRIPRPDGKQNTLPTAHPPGDVFCGNKVVADSTTISRLQVSVPVQLSGCTAGQMESRPLH